MTNLIDTFLAFLNIIHILFPVKFLKAIQLNHLN